MFQTDLYQSSLSVCKVNSVAPSKGYKESIIVLAVLLLGFLAIACSCCPYLYFGSSIMLVTYFVNFRKLNDHLFGKELFIRFTASAFRKLPSIYAFSYFPFGFEGRMWDLIVSVPDHCLSFYFDQFQDSTKFGSIKHYFSQILF